MSLDVGMFILFAVTYVTTVNVLFGAITKTANEVEEKIENEATIADVQKLRKRK